MTAGIEAGPRLASVSAMPPPEQASAREKRLDRAYNAAYRDMDNLLREHGLPTTMLERLLFAGVKLTDAAKRQTSRLRNQLEAALASDGLTDDVRQSILLTIEVPRNRDGALLSEREAQIIETYRTLDAEDKAAVRHVVRSLGRRMARHG
jgi:hypothetical protein